MAGGNLNLYKSQASLLKSRHRIVTGARQNRGARGRAKMDGSRKLIVTAYIIREILRPFAVILGILALLFSGYSLAQILSDAVSGLLPVGSIFALTFLKLLISMDVILPVSLFMAVVTGFGRLQMDGEVTAMQALGMGPREFLAPVMGVALALALLVVGLSVFARPKAYLATHDISHRAAAMMNVNAMEAGTFYASSDGDRVIFLGSRAGPHAPALRVFVAQRERDHIEVIYADNATPAATGTDGRRVVHLFGAHVYQFYPDAPAKDQVLDAAQINVSPDGEITTNYKYSSVAAGMEHLLSSSSPPDVAERQWRLSTGVSTMLLALLGALLSRGQPRQGRYTRFGPAILAYSAYFFACSTARSWVQHGLIGGFPGLWWAPAMLALAIAIIWYVPVWRRQARRPPPGAASARRLHPAALRSLAG